MKVASGSEAGVAALPTVHVLPVPENDPQFERKPPEPFELMPRAELQIWMQALLAFARGVKSCCAMYATVSCPSALAVAGPGVGRTVADGVEAP